MKPSTDFMQATTSRLDKIEAKFKSLATMSKTKPINRERKHTLKMRTEGGKWYVDEGYKVSIFEKAVDAWRYIFVLKEIRPLPPFAHRSLYPVRSLDPTIAGGCKKVVHCF